VLLIEVPDAVVQERILNRRLCLKCDVDYNLIFHRPAVPNTCDICGAALIAGGDDTPEAVQARSGPISDLAAVPSIKRSPIHGAIKFQG
jgi:adenylate kinase